MNFNKHSAIGDRHAFLSPSSYHWINYDERKLATRWASQRAAAKGVALHEYARKAIELRIAQTRNTTALSKYINDGIKYEMSCEQPLYYSDNCFGHTDAISFVNDLLRIHDYKSGIGKTSMTQLEVYAAIFCLEYGKSPFDIGIELRIYQGQEVRVHKPYPDIIMRIMDTIVDFDQHIEDFKEGVFNVD